MADIFSADTVEITISHDGTRVWVDVDGVNRFRAYRVGRLVINRHGAVVLSLAAERPKEETT